MAAELIKETNEQKLRRAWVEREETFKDKSEEFERNKKVASTDEELQALSNEFLQLRAAHRQAEVAAGRRAAGGTVMTRQVFWVTWTEIAVSHELLARSKSGSLAKPSSSEDLRDEFHAAVVAIAASAHAIEALYGELKYLIPVQLRADKQYLIIRNAFAAAFGWNSQTRDKISTRLQQLFGWRDSVVHPYTELSPAVANPSGVVSSAEIAKLNSVSSGIAVDCTLDVIEAAATPAAPYSPWVERWSQQHEKDCRIVQTLRGTRVQNKG